MFTSEMFRSPAGSGVAAPSDGVFDVAVVGAGAAGVGAGRRLSASGLSFVVLEAKDRVGGRAHSLIGRSGAGIDLGCGWLHSADRNPWVAVAEEEGFQIDRSRPAWERRLTGVNMSKAEAEDLHRVFEAFEARLAEAASGPDQPAADLITEDFQRWRPLLDAFSGAYNGAPLRQISVHDYAAYQPTDENWRVLEGYGTLIAQAAAELPIVLEAPVSRIDHRSTPIRLTTPRGDVLARHVIVAVPSTVLAEALDFEPALPEVQSAASALPLGHVDKCFLTLSRPEALPVEQMVCGRTDSADTGSYTLRPFGRPMIEGFFGGDFAGALELESPGAFTAFAIDELVSLFGSKLRRELKPVAESRWGRDPFIRGAYSHAKPGQAGARAVLRRVVDDRIVFAGEACSAHDFSTAHGAYETGIAAADAIVRLTGVGSTAPSGEEGG